MTACTPALGATCVSSPTVNATYAYDPLGRRTHKSGTGVTEAFYLDDEQGNELAEYDGTGALTRRFVPGPGLNDPVAMVKGAGPGYTHSYYHSDHHGSVIATSDDSGALMGGPFLYDPHGNCIKGSQACSALAATNQPFYFTGMRLDQETGCYYVRARIYCPAIGRFLQTDPVGYDVDLNLYTYVNNDPVNKIDPSGKVAAEAAAIGCAVDAETGCVPGAIIGATIGGAIDLATSIGLIDISVSAMKAGNDNKSDSDKAGSANDGAKKGANSNKGEKEQGSRRPTKAQAEAARDRSKNANGKETCYYCGKETTREPGQPNSSEIEHKDPYSRGGRTEDWNLENSCRTCNRGKATQNEQEFRQRIQQKQQQDLDKEDFGED